VMAPALTVMANRVELAIPAVPSACCVVHLGEALCTLPPLALADPNDATQAAALAEEPRELAHDARIVALAHAAESGLLLAVSEDDALTLWDTSTGGRLLQAAAPPSTKLAACAPSGRFVALAGEGPGAQVRRICGSDCEDVGVAELAPEGACAAALALSDDLLAVGTEGGVLLFSIPQLQPLADFRCGGAVRAVAFSQDGALLAGSFAGVEGDGPQAQTAVWRVSQTSRGCSYLGGALSNDAAQGLSFSPDGEMLAISGGTSGVHLVRIGEQLEPAQSFRTSSAATSIAWSPDGQRLVSGEDARASLWDAASGRLLRRLPPERGRVACVSCAARDARVVCAELGGAVVRVCSFEA